MQSSSYSVASEDGVNGCCEVPRFRDSDVEARASRAELELACRSYNGISVSGTTCAMKDIWGINGENVELWS